MTASSRLWGDPVGVTVAIPARDSVVRRAGSHWVPCACLRLKAFNEDAFHFYEPLRRVRDHVESHGPDSLSLDGAAKIACLERSYFSTLFRRKAGIRFSDWLGLFAARVVLNGLTCLTAAVGFACEHGRPPGDGQNERVGLDAPHEAAELRVASPGMPDSVKMLTPSREFVGSGSWGAVAEVVALGDSLFVYDLYGPPAVTVLDRETGGVVGTFGRKGRGPGEFQDMSDVFADQAVPGQFWIYDAPARRLSLYGPGDSAGVGLLRTVPLQVRGYVPYLRLTRTGLMMAGVFDDGSPVVLSDTSGGHMRERYGAYPAHRPGDPSNTALRANEPEVTYRPHGSGLAVAYRHFNLLQFYDLESGRVVSVVGPNPFEPRPEDLVDLNPKKFAYAKVRSTARYVYALFCGCTNRDRSRPLLLQVFTWDGEFVTVVAIDHRSWQWVFDVSPDDRFIYTMTEHPQPLVLETALPPRLRDPARSP